jgi:hypothetical protein
MPYKIGKTIDASDVPDWVRTTPKWSELVDLALSLEPGQSTEIEFDNEKEAERARNAVRDQANLKARSIVVRTRVVGNEDGSSTLYIIRVHPTMAHHQESQTKK